MNSGERNLAELNERRIQQQKQQVAPIVDEDALLAKQPVQFYSNHHRQQLAREPNPKGERITLQANTNQNRINVTLQGTAPEAVLNTGPTSESEKCVERAKGNALTDVGNGVSEPDEPPLHTTKTGSSSEQTPNHGRTSSSSSVMRDPQESHHRSVPTAGGPLGEVESGEDDNDCVVVVPSNERKVEPLKINLARDREPLRTVIKLTPGASSTPDSFQQLSPTIRDVPGSPKITIKPPKPPQTVENALMVVVGSAGTSASSSAAVRW